MAKVKKGDKKIKIGTFDSNKHLTPLNVIGFITTLNKFNEINKVEGTPSSLFQSYADTNVIDKTDSSTAYATFGKKSGLCNGDMQLSPVGRLLLKERIDIHEYEFLLLTKQWIWLDDCKKHLLKEFYMAFYENGIDISEKANEKASVDDADSENTDTFETESKTLPKKNKIFSDYFSAAVGPRLAQILDVDENDVTNRLEFFRTALLISRLCIIKDNTFQINPDASAVWTIINKFDFAEPANDPSSEEYYNYLGNTSNGIFEIEDLEPLKQLYPNLYYIKYHKDMKTEQIIYYGAPGTGKSHEIKQQTLGKSVIRTTFHPDSDYSTFVGAYKPTMVNVENKVVPVVFNNGISLDQNNGTYQEKRISYQFVKQAFLKAYLGAWKKYVDGTDSDKEQYLIIEEINRGNCAQIFGDLFQLLDRADNGFSEYPIEADTDLQIEIEKAFKEEDEYKLSKAIQIDNVIKDYISNYHASLSEDVQKGRVLLFPPTLYIWATMNTSDQSLFPIDSAFKRRWDWKYVKIAEGKDENGQKLDWKIDVPLDDDGNKLSWWAFIQKINEIIASMTSSADKQLGYFFCTAKNKEIDKQTFVSKVIFYLWNDVFKDYGFEDTTLFRYKLADGTEKDLTFPDFYDEDGKDINAERLSDFLKKVMNWKRTTNKGD